MRRPRRFQAGGWVPPGAHWRLQRADQGNDIERLLGEYVVAPGHGVCLAHLSDRDWPQGFGSPYAHVRVDSGIMRGEWYVGHCNKHVIPVGRHFHTGDKLAQMNHGLNPGWGWAEIGRMIGGHPAPMGDGAKWRHLLHPVWLLA